jgi:hypothetical protein
MTFLAGSDARLEDWKTVPGSEILERAEFLRLLLDIKTDLSIYGSYL